MKDFLLRLRCTGTFDLKGVERYEFRSTFGKTDNSC